jgi:hypothetical protein
LFLLIVPGAVVARSAQLTWPITVAVGPTLTYGVVAAAIIPFGTLGIPWNGWTALAALLVVAVVVAGLRVLLGSYRDPAGESRAVTRWPAVTVAAGVLLGALAIWYAALRGIGDWQSIPSTWDAAWHGNTVRFILDTGQASSTHMGELRNVETHDVLYYPSAFHALVAVDCQLTGAAPASAYTLNSLAAASWLFPVSAAVLTWRALRSRAGQWRVAAAAGSAAALSASFTAVPYIEFDTAAMPSLVAYGLAAPAFALITSCPRHRDRIPPAVLALVGAFSAHIAGGAIAVVLVVAWWLAEALWHPVRGRLADGWALILVVVPAALVLLPQLRALRQLEGIIAGHSYLTHLGRKRGLFDAVFQHSRHLNDFGVQYALIGLAAVGGLSLLVMRIWWPLAVWLLLIVADIDSGAPLGGPIGAVVTRFGEAFYHDPRRLSAAVTLLLAPMAGIGLVALAIAAKRFADELTRRCLPTPVWGGITAVLLVTVSLAGAWYYFPRHRFLFGEKYDSVMIDQRDLEAMAYLATLPGARDTLIGNANTDGTTWMYAVAGLHPLWTHYDYPVQQGPGFHRFIFWAYADDADTDPRIGETVRVLGIRYILVSTPTVGGFAMPDGLVSLDKSTSWVKIYDNGEARIYEWHGAPGQRP